MLVVDVMLDAWVSQLRNVPVLMEHFREAKDVQAYKDHYPDATNVRAAIFNMADPGILVTYEGTNPDGKGRWQHSFTLHLRAKGSYSALIDHLINGRVNDAEALKLLNARIHPLCLPMTLPTIARATLVIRSDDRSETLDFFQIKTSLVEEGDN